MTVAHKYRVVERVTDKRNERRVCLAQEVECEGEGGKFSRRVADISVGGMFVETLTAFAPGTTITTRFRLPNFKDPIQANAKVAYIQEKIGSGLEFLDLALEDRDRIDELVRKLVALRAYNTGGSVYRVLVNIPVTLRATAKNGNSFAEPVNIVTLAKNGATIRTETTLDLDTTVFLRMPTGSEFEGRVLGQGREEVWIQCRSLARSLGFYFP